MAINHQSIKNFSSLQYLLEVSAVSRKEGGSYIVKNISFAQNVFQKIAVSGATGSGKTTLLKMIAGLVTPTEGSITFAGEKLKGPEEKLIPGHPSIAYLSQHFELRNHYRVAELLAMSQLISANEADAIYGICRIGHLLQRWTHQLSGGEKQRIALSQLLVSAPKLLLLDEPYSNLDAIHKEMLKAVIGDVGAQLNMTVVLVSHDPLDTLPWADEILVLKDGGLIQKGTPVEIYKQPLSDYAAALFGKYTVLSPSLAKAFSELIGVEHKAFHRYSRPEDFIMTSEGNGLSGEVTKVNFMGSFYEAEVLIAGHKLIVNTGRHRVNKGDVIFISLSLE